MAVKGNIWTTVAETKVYLGIPVAVTDFDAVLEDILNAAGPMVENMLGRTVIDDANDITEIQDGDPLNEGQFIVFVENYPINAFTSIAFNTGTSSTPIWTVEDADNFVRKDEEGALYFEDKFNPFRRPIPRGRQNVRIIYQGGFIDTPSTMPDDLIIALQMQAAKLFQKRKSQGLISEAVAGTNISWNKEMDLELKQIIDTRRRYF